MGGDVLEVRFLKKEKIAESTYQFFFEKPFDFFPGQYTTIFLGNDSRDFTLVSSPLENDFSIVTKEGVSKFKKELFSLPIGATIMMKKPAGGFTIPDKSPHEYVFLAGGIGMNPFYNMIAYNHKKKLNIPMTLLVSFSKKDHVIFYDELAEIAKENKKIKTVYSLTNEKWEGETGRITEEMIKKHVLDVKNKKYLIAGGEQMVEDTQNLLIAMGIDEANIRIDIFTGY